MSFSMNKMFLIVGVPIAIGLVLLVTTNSAGMMKQFSNITSDNNKPITTQKPQESENPQPSTEVLALDPKITYDNIIPPIDYDAQDHKGIGLQYPPAYVANKCLFYFSHVRNATAWEYGVYVAKWLALHGSESEQHIVFAYDFPLTLYNLTAGWKSAPAQSAASECFLKAYAYTGDNTYLTLAKKSLMFLTVPTEDGGVTIKESNDRWWYEEFPSKGGSYVLNGHQSVLLALSKYLDIDNDPVIRQLFDNGLRALKADASLYDRGTNDSFYDRLGHPANRYHSTHITNFQKLYDITHDEQLLEIKKAFME